MAKDRINVLLVDDEVAFLESMTKRLSVRDFNVVAVDRGEKAIEAAREHPIDIAIVDLRMPGLDGEQTLEALKEEHEYLEVAILTGHGSFESAVQLSKKGAYFYLQKPCKLHVLLEVLTEAYKRRVMKKRNIDKERMKEILQEVKTAPPTAVLEKLRELDQD